MRTISHQDDSLIFPLSSYPDLEKAGYLEPETNPLYLLRHSIRIIIVATFFFVGTSVFFLDRMNPNSWVILAAVIPYLIGILLKAARLWLLDKLDRVPTIWWSDVKAILVLGLMAAATFLYLWGTPLTEPWDDMTLATVLFYFGSR